MKTNFMTIKLARENLIQSRYVPFVLLGLILLVIAKDLFHASIRNYHFYLSESLLFGTFWLMFLPLILSIKHLSKRSSSRLFRKFAAVIPFAFSLLHLLLFPLFVSIISRLFYAHSFGISQTLVEAVSENGISCFLIYGISTLIFFKQENSEEEIPKQKKSSKIKLLHKGISLILDCKDILYVKSDKPYIAIHTQERTYLHPGTLKAFLTEKAPESFIQIHKSTLVNTDAITSFTSRKNGDYDLILSNQDCVRASRSFKHEFKRYIDSISLA